MTNGPRDRRDPRHYTPDPLPRELAHCDTSVAPLAVGRPGKVGLLELTFARTNAATRLVHHFQEVPLQIFRPLYIDPLRPDMAFVYTLSSGGGILQGDRYRIDLIAEAGAAVHCTTQAATRIYRTEANFATQIVNVIAAPDAYVEYLPHPVIPYRDARFFQRATLIIDPCASVLYGETLLPGRVAYGERHAYTLFLSQTEARRPDGELLFADTVKLNPAAGRLCTPARFSHYDVLATLSIVSPLVPLSRLVRRLQDVLMARDDVIAGASELPGACGATIRILGPDATSVQAAMRAAWTEARLMLIGAPAPATRTG